MSSNLPNDPNKGRIQEPFGDLMKSMNDFFHKRPVRGLLQSMDEFFKSPFASFPVEVEELEEEHVIKAELPGVKKEQISIDVLDNSVTISVRNEEVLTEEDHTKNVYKRRQSLQHMSRNIFFGHPINEGNVKATYQDGLLKIRIPKPKGKGIRIEDD